KKGVFLADTNKWMEIKETYTARGGEQYMYIGNFHQSNDSCYHQQIFPDTTVSTKRTFRYYYIDEVAVISPVHCNTFINIHDSMLCNSFKLQLTSVEGADVYTWNNGQSTQKINITRPGKYWCVASKDTCDLYIDTFRIVKYIDTIQHYYDTVVCLH